MDPNQYFIPPAVSGHREDAGFALMTETVTEKDGVGVSTALAHRVSPSKRGLKLRPEAHEKRLA